MDTAITTISVAEVQEILAELRVLELHTYPRDRAEKLIQRLVRLGVVIVQLLPGKTLLRLRPNNNGAKHTSKDQLWYRPQKNNTTYQRASTPKATMFYGCLQGNTPEGKENRTEIVNAQLACAVETFKWFRDKRSCCYQKITYSRWQVTNLIEIVGIVHFPKFVEATPFAKELNAAHKDFLTKYKGIEQQTALISEFFADQFGRDDADSSHDYLYLLSAVYSEIIVKSGFQGVMYPSVRVEGQSLNVALTPETVHSSLKLIAAGEGSIYKYLGNGFIDNDAQAETILDENKIEYIDITDERFHIGQEKMLNHLGLSSISALCDCKD